MILTTQSFFNHLMFSPGDGHPNDRIKTIVAIIALAIFTAGIAYAVCAIRRAYMICNKELTESGKRIDKLGKEILSPNQIIDINNIRYNTVVGGRYTWPNTRRATPDELAALKKATTRQDYLKIMPDYNGDKPPFRITPEEYADGVNLDLNPVGMRVYVNQKERWTIYWDDQDSDQKYKEIEMLVKEYNGNGRLLDLSDSLIWPQNACLWMFVP